MKKVYGYLIFLQLTLVACAQSPEKVRAQYIDSDNRFTELSADFLSDLKDEKAVEQHIKSYAELDLDSLNHYLKSPAQKKAFWINTYNGFIQYLLRKEAELFEDRLAFFSKERINIGGKRLSFDDIEHGILRASTLKLSLGYAKNPFASDFEVKFRMKNTDERIHFVLNCGARSCPPVGIYSAEDLDREVDQVAKAFLNSVTDYDADQNEVNTTILFSWFRGDFGGNSGIRRTLIRYGVLPNGSEAELNYRAYDWTLQLNNYVED
jgi:hypothetical protein